MSAANESGQRSPSPGSSGAAFVGFVVLASAVVLATALGLMAWEVLDLRREIGGRPPGVGFRALTDLIETPVPDCRGESHRLAETPSSHLLLFLFTPYDCPICHEELLELQGLHERIPDLDVYGIMASASREDGCQTERNFGLSFPILVDREGALVDALAPPETPWKVLLRRDGSGTYILFEDPKSSIPAEREAFRFRMQLLTSPFAGELL